MNYLALVVATAVAFVLGHIWYGPLFGKIWVQEKFGGKMEKPSQQKMIVLLGTTVILTFVIVAGLSRLTPLATPLMALGGALVIYFFFVLPVLIIQAMYGGNSVKVALIDLGYWLVLFGEAGGVLALMKG